MTIILVIISASVLYPKGPAFRAGIDGSIFPLWKGLDFITAGGLPVLMDYDMRGHFSAGVFVDMRNFRFDLSYTSTMGSFSFLQYKYWTNANVTITNSVVQSYITLGALFKIPFQLVSNTVVIWPAAGLEYQFCLSSGWNNVNTLTNSYDNRHELYFKIGCGADILLQKGFYFVPLILVGYSIFPIPYFDTDNDPVSMTRSFSDARISGYDWKIVMNIGFALDF